MPDVTRRQFLQTTAIASTAIALGPYFSFGKALPSSLMKRTLGRTGFEATTLGLGGQASLQWTLPGVDPVKIILKAFDLGVNYFDTSNAYGPSQANYGKAFRQLHLVPGEPGYNEALRRSMWLTTKTGLRFAKGGHPGVRVFTNGPAGTHTADDVRRSLSLMFGDGQGYYPKGAYLDMVLNHNVSQMEEVDALYEGYDRPDPKAETIGALAVLIDLRDGTNATGLNPKEEKLIRHIGFSGHANPAVSMEMIQRDTRNVLDGMLVAINANDRLHFNMQYNVIPVAAARNMALIAMKVFADGAMYTKPATWSHSVEDVVRTIGSPTLPSRRLIEYTLTTPGIHTAIIGTGQIDGDDARCQLRQNLAAAQVAPGGLSHSDRRAVEKLAAQAKSGQTNYFQAAAQPLGAPRQAALAQQIHGRQRMVKVEWQTAYAGDEPIVRYEVLRDHGKVGEIAYQPQITRQPIVFHDRLTDSSAHEYEVVTVDSIGRKARTAALKLTSA
jgi:aryl-alcohol dehydrogenase-like predicted oxidoreductase